MTLLDPERARTIDPRVDLGEVEERSIVRDIADVAHRSPSAVAISSPRRDISYQQMWAESGALANRVVGEGVVAGDPVALCADRTVGFVVAMVALMRCGAVAVPLAAELPTHRRLLMADEAGTRVAVLAEGAASDAMAIHETAGRSVIDARMSTSEAHTAFTDRDNPGPAYIFFTSGTSGVPKGVLGTQTGLSHFVAWQRTRFAVRPGDRVPLLKSISFDAILREIFTPLVAGATICVAPDLDPGEVLPWIAESGATILHATPSHAELWLSALDGRIVEGNLRWTAFAGEPLSGSLVNRWRSAVRPAGRIVNMYGPTETTMVKTFHLVSAEVQSDAVLPVGRALPNTQVLVVSDGRVCGPNERGEVWLRTRTGTLGYVNDRAAHEAAFIRNPFSDDDSDVVYRTGDHGFLSSDGVLTVTGRIDDQVKVLGVRIEPAEVAAYIREHPGVDNVAVIPGGGSRVQLIAHVATRASDLDATMLRRYLADRLPRPMVPSQFVFHDVLPLTPNGKVDMRALETSSPDPPSARSGTQRIADRLRRLPETERAAAIAALRERAASRDADRGDEESDRAPVFDGARSERAPLSFAQERLWFLDRMDPGAAAYNIRSTIRLRGPLDVEALRAACDGVAARHAVLRTRYPDADGRPWQTVDPVGGAPFEFVETGDLATAERMANEAGVRPFDLAAGPVWRVVVHRVTADLHVLVIVIHHIAADGWSMPILFREIAEFYASRLRGRAPDLPTLRVQYRDHAQTQRERFTAGAFEEGLAYWTQQLAGPLSPLDLPTDRPRPPLQSARGGRIEFRLDGVDVAALASLAAAERATPSMTWLALFKAFLHRYSGSTDIVVGGPSADRDLPETEPLIGLFVNTLAYRTRLAPEWSARRLLGEVRRVALDAYRYRDVPFERVVIAANAERDPSRTPVFQVMFQHGEWAGRGISLDGLAAEPVGTELVSSKFDLELEVAERGGTAHGRLTFNADLYEETTARRMMEHFAVLARAAVTEPDRPIGELPLMDAAERERLVFQMSGGDPDSAVTTVLDMIARWVEEAPDRRALVQDDVSLTYRQLDDLACSIASHLQRRGIGRGDRVAIAMRRSPGVVAAILGVLRTGAAYVPLDAASPAERTAYLVADAAPAAILVDDPTPPPGVDGPVVLVSAIDDEAQPDDQPRPSLDDAAYVIYTSGTTGAPKGVIVDHRSLASFAAAASTAYGLGTNDRLLQFHSFAFDTSVEETFCTLVAGGTLVLRTDEMIGSIDRFLSGVDCLGITVLDLPTAFWNVFAADVLASGRDLPASVRMVVMGGEAADPELVARWKERFDGTVRLVNGYGPTETTVTATVADLTALAEPGVSAVTIGRPLASTTAYVVDGHGQPVPIGVRGELLLGGSQVAIGYLGSPDLTSERFAPAPFGRTGRVYRTGDLVRWRPDGNLEFLGRVDRQLKVRGFRIEPGEIEAHLVRHPDVSIAFVHLWEGNGEVRLVAYVVAEPGHGPDPADLADHLRSRVPDYMVPAIEVVADLPTNQNDKVDVSRLPPPTSRPAGSYEPPRGEAMIRMAGLWAELLGVERVAANDRFFDLGGHSLLAVELVSRVERELRTVVPLATVFTHPTLAEFTARVTVSPTLEPSPLLVPIRREGTRRPLFCLPVTDGSVLAYERLSRHLHADVPILGLVARGADGVSPPHRTIEAMCGEYASAIMAAVPSPYRLLGASFAGILALETASQIRERGGEVELIVMLDTVMPRRESWVDVRRRWGALIRHGGWSGGAAVMRELWKRARVRLGRLRHAPRWHLRTVANRPLPAALAGKRLTHVSLGAERSYEPSPYEGRVLYFRASGEAQALPEARDEPWRAFITDLEVVDSAGTHWGEGSMLDEPHLPDLCAVLVERLDGLDLEGEAS